MRRSSWMSLLLLLVAASFARADDDAGKRAAVRASMEALSSPEEAVRAKAAAQLAEPGSFGAEEVARHGEGIGDRAWSALAVAFLHAKCSSSAVSFVAASYTAPAAHRRRLLELAHALDPEAGVERSAEEVAKVVHDVLVAASRTDCLTDFDLSIAVLGHPAVAPLLARLKDGDRKYPGGTVECMALAFIAEKEDVPAIRELLCAGKVNLAEVLDRMQRRGIPEATGALLDAVSAGNLDAQVTRALQNAPDRERVLKVVNAWIASQDRVDEGARANLATLFEKLEAREAVPTMEAWLATSKKPDVFTSIADALVHFGDPKGVGLLVRIAGERQTRFPCRPSTPEEVAAAAAPDRLCPEGFPQWDRSRAAETLSRIAGAGVFDVPEDWIRVLREKGPDRESDDHFLDRAAAAFRAWWAASKDRLRFDTAARRWTVGE